MSVMPNISVWSSRRTFGSIGIICPWGPWESIEGEGVKEAGGGRGSVCQPSAVDSFYIVSI